MTVSCHLTTLTSTLLTSLFVFQNPLADWGANYYFKGAPLSKKPSDDLNPKKFDEILKIALSKDHVSAVLLEYFPHIKINSAPADSAPFRRDLTGNALILFQWRDDTPEKNLKAKEMAHAIADLMPAGEAYGNYGTFARYVNVGARHSDMSLLVGPDIDAAPTATIATADKTRALFREHYPRLQAIKKKYDPDMIFNRWYTIIPA